MLSGELGAELHPTGLRSVSVDDHDRLTTGDEVGDRRHRPRRDRALIVDGVGQRRVEQGVAADGDEGRGAHGRSTMSVVRSAVKTVRRYPVTEAL